MLLHREALLQRTRLLGPAFVAAVAYVDPGNVATNTQAGAAFGYLLLWVLVGATLMAGLVQYLSAKVGWLTGETLPALVARRNSPLPRICYWIQAELVRRCDRPGRDRWRRCCAQSAVRIAPSDRSADHDGCVDWTALSTKQSSSAHF
jgi:hypothetical protein